MKTCEAIAPGLLEIALDLLEIALDLLEIVQNLQAIAQTPPCQTYSNGEGTLARQSVFPFRR